MQVLYLVAWGLDLIGICGDGAWSSFGYGGLERRQKVQKERKKEREREREREKEERTGFQKQK